MSNWKNYYAYLNSPLWFSNREKAWEHSDKRCSICKKKFDIEYHHYKAYGAIWTRNDWRYIKPLCAYHHHAAHFRLWFIKIPLKRPYLEVRYYELWLRIRLKWGTKRLLVLEYQFIKWCCFQYKIWREKKKLGFLGEEVKKLHEEVMKPRI